METIMETSVRVKLPSEYLIMSTGCLLYQPITLKSC